MSCSLIRKLVSLVLCAAFIACLPYCYVSYSESEKSLDVTFDESAWFDKSVEDVEKYLTRLGYKADQSTKTGFFKNVVWMYTNENLYPHKLSVWFITDTHIVNQVVMFFKKNAQTFNTIESALDFMYNNANFVEAKTEKKGGQTSITNEHVFWQNGRITYQLFAVDENTNEYGHIADARNGKSDFRLAITCSYNYTENPTPTPKPTATPKPVKCELSVDSVKLKDNRYGTVECYVVIKNNSSATVDRADFMVEYYDAYGDLINHAQYSCFTTDIINPGKTSATDVYWYAPAGAVKAKVAIIKYHTTSGKTITIPENQYSWRTFYK